MTENDLPEDDIERGLEAAFGREGPKSVLASMGGRASRVALRDSADEEATPLIKPLPAGQEGRYQVLGELARGAVGVVLKGHDVDLGRSVAIKVLRAEHAKNTGVVKRFIEEAQVGGQLQHPGIVPVYEMGIRDDGETPWFAMKLVKGRTLGALLADRKTPHTDRRRFLRIFEQVCQTVAYAHSRGVVHRDLKPENVMVGAFGQVQVVDWGFAKVLQRDDDKHDSVLPTEAQLSVIETVRSASTDAHSVVGSVFGTPAYMPPEQARGMVDDVDERSDVFALGAILCEILTGEPAYSGKGMDVIRRAASADLDAATQRLDASGAAPGVLSICKECLVAAKMARPADAGEVADLVAAHFASEEEKARAAHVAAVRSKAAAEHARSDALHARQVAEHHRRQRRLTLAVGAAFLLVIAAVSGSWAWLQEDRAERAVENARDIEAALAHSAFLRGRAIRLADTQAARDAVRTARRANELAVSRNVDPDLLERTVEVVAESAAESEAATDVAKALRRAAHLQKQRRFREALQVLATAAADHPTCAEAHHQLGLAMDASYMRGPEISQLSDIANAYRTAVSLDPENLDYRAVLHDSLITQGESLDEAATHSRALRELAPGDSQFVELAFEEALRRNRLDEAARLVAVLGADAERASRRLDRVVRGVTAADDVLRTRTLPDNWDRDRWEIVDACLLSNRYATVARLWEFPAAGLSMSEEWKADRNAALRYATLRAGFGDGTDAAGVAELDRKRWREAGLSAYRDGPIGQMPNHEGQQSLVVWIREGARMPGVRKPRPGGYTATELLEMLPPDERETWSTYLVGLQRFESGITLAIISAWETVIDSELARDAYHEALLVFEGRLTTHPEDYFARSGLGAAQFRVGLYDQAIVTLLDVEVAYSTADTGVRPSTLSFLAMSYAKSGDGVAARETLARMQSLAAEELWARNPNVATRLKETEEVVEAAAPSSQPGER